MTIFLKNKTVIRKHNDCCFLQHIVESGDKSEEYVNCLNKDYGFQFSESKGKLVLSSIFIPPPAMNEFLDHIGPKGVKSIWTKHFLTAPSIDDQSANNIRVKDIYYLNIDKLFTIQDLTIEKIVVTNNDHSINFSFKFIDPVINKEVVAKGSIVIDSDMGYRTKLFTFSYGDKEYHFKSTCKVSHIESDLANNSSKRSVNCTKETTFKGVVSKKVIEIENNFRFGTLSDNDFLLSQFGMSEPKISKDIVIPWYLVIASMGSLMLLGACVYKVYNRNKYV
jgi:hypothetical protein